MPATLVFGQQRGSRAEGLVILIIPTDKPTHRADVFVSPDNINALIADYLKRSGAKGLDLLSIDIDSHDY